MTDYAAFLAAKERSTPPTGLTDIPPLNSKLMPFQHDITTWALRRGRSAVFADCGLGKTVMQLEWAHRVPGRVLILAPLAVSGQTVLEGAKFDIPVVYARHGDETDAPITITNYEMLQHFDPDDFNGIVLDESSILKAYDGKFRSFVIEAFANTPFRLACTATPAPNDFMELGNHSEFLGVMSRTEMLAMYFVHDGGSTSSWRLKGHARRPFWQWLAEWAVMLRKPSDLGYEDNGFNLPPLNITKSVVRAETTPDGMLFPVEAATLQERISERRQTISQRVAATAAAVNNSSDRWIVWCNLNGESEALVRAIPDAVEVRGSDTLDAKEYRLRAFSDGRTRVLVTKPTIAGHGMNWQHCHKMAFVGLSDSWEQWYQAIRRCWRFGQTSPVDVLVVISDTEGAVVRNIERKEHDAGVMFAELVAETHNLSESALHGATARNIMPYAEDTATGQGWTMHLGDCVEHIKSIPDQTVDYTIFSPPFASLYTYTNSPRDMGNSEDGAEFAEHFAFLSEDLLRITKPGRLCSFHCMNLPTSKVRDGVIGLRDFRGELIQMFVDAGWVFHSEVVIWKDPVTAMQRTKALGLLYKQLKKDSAMSRQGIPDYLVTMRAPGVNPEPVTHTPETFPVRVWQNYASPVWMDINPSDTITFREAREHADERHICPLQLEVIRRSVRLWSNPDDLVFSPFAGVGSEGYVALQEGRQFMGIELKRSYYDTAITHLKAAQPLDLFAAEATP